MSISELAHRPDRRDRLPADGSGRRPGCWTGAAIDGRCSAARCTCSPSLPPAVFCFMVAEQYKQEPDKVASIVLLGNLASLGFVPLGLWLGLLARPDGQGASGGRADFHSAREQLPASHCVASSPAARRRRADPGGPRPRSAPARRRRRRRRLPPSRHAGCAPSPTARAAWPGARTRRGSRRPAPAR